MQILAFMNKNLKAGALTELKCQTFLIENDFIISKPILDNARYDLVLDYNNKFYRIQIKTARQGETEETFVFNCKSQHSIAGGNKIMKYSPDEIDFFMTEYQGEFYLVPCDKIRAQFTMRLSDKFKRVNNLNNVNWAKDYKALDVIKTLH